MNFHALKYINGAPRKKTVANDNVKAGHRRPPITDYERGCYCHVCAPCSVCMDMCPNCREYFGEGDACENCGEKP